MDVQCETYKQTLFCPELGHETLPIEYLGEAPRNGAAVCNRIRDQLAQPSFRLAEVHKLCATRFRFQAALLVLLMEPLLVFDFFN